MHELEGRQINMYSLSCMSAYTSKLLVQGDGPTSALDQAYVQRALSRKSKTSKQMTAQTCQVCDLPTILDGVKLRKIKIVFRFVKTYQVRT